MLDYSAYCGEQPRRLRIRRRTFLFRTIYSSTEQRYQNGVRLLMRLLINCCTLLTQRNLAAPKDKRIVTLPFQQSLPSNDTYRDNLGFFFWKITLPLVSTSCHEVHSLRMCFKMLDYSADCGEQSRRLRIRRRRMRLEQSGTAGQCGRTQLGTLHGGRGRQVIESGQQVTGLGPQVIGLGPQVIGLGPQVIGIGRRSLYLGNRSLD